MMEGKTFRFPHKIQIGDLEDYLQERRCIVVSFFGKTTYANRENKGRLIEKVTGNSYFERDKPTAEPEIEAVFDEDRDVVFLQMTSCFDTYVAVENCKKAEHDLKTKGFASFWSSKRYEHAKSLLFLFQVSHILVCCHPGYSFDVSYVQLFKSLDNLRNNIQAAVSQLLTDVPVSLPKDWILNGRACPPRVLFFFQSAPPALRGHRGDRDERKDAKVHKHPPIKRLENSLEDQIYRILRKTRIITNIAVNSLFAVPVNQEFVYVDNGEKRFLNDPDSTYMNAFYSLLNGEVPKRLNLRGPFYHQHLTEEMRPANHRSFVKFLNGHINYAFEKGFFDNISSKHGTNYNNQLWEVPLLTDWLVVANELYTFLIDTLSADREKEHGNSMCELFDDMDTEAMFSELKCKKVLPQAFAVYEENLPPHYTEEYHNAKLIQAMSVYSLQARGPASEKYAEKLAAQCLDHWHSGRMRCEEISLTGNQCTHRRHMMPGADGDSKEKGGLKLLPTLTHTSGVQYIAACNCGRRQANREDPFNLCEANNTFYQDLEEDCCKDLEHVEFPVYHNLKLNSSVSQTSQAKLLLDEIKEHEGADSDDEASQPNSEPKEPEVRVDANDSSGELLNKDDPPAIFNNTSKQDQSRSDVSITSNDHLTAASSHYYTCNEERLSSDDSPNAAKEMAATITTATPNTSTDQDALTTSNKCSQDEEELGDSHDGSHDEAEEPDTAESTNCSQDRQTVGSNNGSADEEDGEPSDMKRSNGKVANKREVGATRVVDTPTNEDETEIILEVLENLHLDGGSNSTPSKVETLLARAARPVLEFLPHMKTLSSPSGLKPEYASWSLVMIGLSHNYSHSAGLSSQPGFISNAKFLLPWEVTLTKKTTSDLNPAKWLCVLENVVKRSSHRSISDLNNDKVVIKVFLGFEYECPRGHRFMVSGPHKPMKSSTVTRESAARMVASDMPLYIACPCKNNNPLVAQLMRVHVVTPKAPVHITFFPQVQPSPGGPIFVSGWDAPHRLPVSTYWVLRLPYVYSGEGGAHLPPSTPPNINEPHGVLLKGCIGIDEDYVDD